MSTNKEYLQIEREKEWRAELRKTIANKERTAKERVRMPEMDPQERIKYQNREVNTGLSPEMAQAEASRCLDCANPTCIEGCPVSINIPKFVKYIELGKFLDAAKTLKETSALPAVCGRVCPQEKQCEATCFYTQKNEKRSGGYWLSGAFCSRLRTRKRFHVGS